MMNRDELAQQYINRHLAGCTYDQIDRFAKSAFEFADAVMAASNKAPYQQTWGLSFCVTDENVVYSTTCSASLLLGAEKDARIQMTKRDARTVAKYLLEVAGPADEDEAPVVDY